MFIQCLHINLCNYGIFVETKLEKGNNFLYKNLTLFNNSSCQSIKLWPCFAGAFQMFNAWSSYRRAADSLGREGGVLVHYQRGTLLYIIVYSITMLQYYIHSPSTEIFFNLSLLYSNSNNNIQYTHYFRIFWGVWNY